MNRIIQLSLIIAVLSSCNQEAEYNTFGAVIEAGNPIAVNDLVPEEFLNDSVKIKVEGVIDDVCQMKGCWMTLKNDDGTSIRVTFKDYGFFVPMDASGKRVILEGMAILEEIDPETAEHYAEEAGKEADTTNLVQLSIVADGVLIAVNQP